MSLRVVSMEAKNMVYHRAECRYAKKIYKRNKMLVPKQAAEKQGYRPCKCCDSMNFFYQLGKEEITSYAQEKNMNLDFKDGKIYVRTDAGCWKILYIKSIQKFILHHKNHVEGRIALEEIENGGYHRQWDVETAKSIMDYLQYIQKHDTYKPIMLSDYHQLPRDSKEQKKYYNVARRRDKRRSARRVDMLFAMIESQHGMKQISYC